ncbi:adenosine deaminase [Pseudovibrio ascidiaceicola]|uniref:adenosine deaminase n=1 Tax=Pseudovibrio ascidiaceicola TaxID=285279 RepID=A0A1I4FKS8_9HYPH|nr:adenosine deaminase [Pseudovibrio ascidiaceicola]SFL17517.1 adenosine deaminase [Pseudovibrio ascidiaceicola]
MSSNLLSMPKVELHTHIDCSLDFGTAARLKPGMSFEDYQEAFIAPEKCTDLSQFLMCIDPALVLLQTKLALQISVDGMIRQLAADHVVYAEIRFAPHLHTRIGLRTEEVVETVLGQMFESSEREGIYCRLILCTLRHFNEEQSFEVADLVARYQTQGVVALDLAADEANFPLDEHTNAFRRANTLGLNTIAHAGEASGADSVLETLDKLSVSRIGHGVRSVEDPRVLERLIKDDIHLEVCPSCNIQTEIFPRLKDHSLAQLKDAGVKLSLNTDARATTNVSLTQEYERVQKALNWTEQDLITSSQLAIKASFAPDDIKRSVQQKLEAYTVKA